MRFTIAAMLRVRKKEGMELTQGLVTGELPPALLPIEEHGMKLLVDIQARTQNGLLPGPA
ncbi:hypothetical protein NBY27_08035 [Escherichia coli]|uniref:hypothetical protein n=1 Tax=Escherichia coli TaxID=562 RepID=UPI00202F2EE8|nr:hypothetical protein [Escherichia coli]URU61089.1 hypothetical protein NBY27_08035 [Escherichia coli]